jgi:hypothetical protein
MRMRSVRMKVLQTIFRFNGRVTIIKIFFWLGMDKWEQIDSSIRKIF